MSSITELKSQCDDALTAMALADELALRGHPEGRKQAELDRDKAAEHADQLILTLLLTKPSNKVEAELHEAIWLEHGQDIIEMFPNEMREHYTLVFN